MLKMDLKLVSFLRENKKRVRIRLGSTNMYNSKYPELIINSIDAIKTSANKLLMKKAFQKANVKTADWFNGDVKLEITNESVNGIPYPIVAKNYFGSRGTGNYLLKTEAELREWIRDKNLNNYLFEKFYNYNREYRLHVSKDGCFYTCRKVLKNDTPENQRWFRNDSNSNWILESNELFDKPVNWKTIEAECVKALKAVGLDFAAMDVRVQSSETSKGKKRENPDFIIIECNSAPSFGQITLQMYFNQIRKFIVEKLS